MSHDPQKWPADHITLQVIRTFFHAICITVFLHHFSNIHISQDAMLTMNLRLT